MMARQTGHGQQQAPGFSAPGQPVVMGPQQRVVGQQQVAGRPASSVGTGAATPAQRAASANVLLPKRARPSETPGGLAILESKRPKVESRAVPDGAQPSASSTAGGEFSPPSSEAGRDESRAACELGAAEAGSGCGSGRAIEGGGFHPGGKLRQRDQDLRPPKGKELDARAVMVFK